MLHVSSNPNTQPPLVSVIIPVYNDAVRLEFCLTALETQTYANYEVIVVDNGSTNREIERVCKQFELVTFSTEAKPGSYAARNKGLSLANGEIIAFTDSDCIPEPIWLEKGVERFLDTPHCGLVAGHIRVFPQSHDQPTAVELYEMFFAFPQQTYVENNFGATANVFTSKSVIAEVGLFNDSLKSGGDSEWGGRFAAKGFVLVYSHEACVWHPARRTFAELHKKARRTIGGLRDMDSRPSRAAVLLKEFLKPPVKLSLRVLRDKQHGFSLQQKLRVCSVATVLRYIGAAETVKHWIRKAPSSRA